jgi:alpha-glucosidase
MKLYRYEGKSPIYFSTVEDELDYKLIDSLEICGITLSNGVFNLKLSDEDVVYGLGQQIRGINKRGWKYISNNADDFDHTEGKNSLYGSHNLFMIGSDVNIGIYIETSGIVEYDIGYEKHNQFTFKPLSGYKLYIVLGGEFNYISKKLRQSIGKPYLPPKWALGIMQSRWGYKDQKDFESIIENYEKNDFPLDMVCLDIDYMKDFKNFTIDTERFKDLKSLSNNLKDKGIRLIPIIDAGVKAQDGYFVSDEGVKEGFFIKDKDGKEFVSAVWPGHVYFPDFANTKAKEWFSDYYKILVDMGIEGVWNDMNEPAMFYSPKRLDEALDEISKLKGKNMGIHEYFEMKSRLFGLSNSPDDYNSMFHNINGRKVNHMDIHNTYGSLMIESTNIGFSKYRKDVRSLIFGRASDIYAHKFGGIWTGDNKSWWSHLKLNLSMLPSLNMAGFLYIGADIGGFGDHATEDLVLAWMKLSILTPLYRNHSALGTRHQEPFSFSDENRKYFKNILKLRKSLEAMIYSEMLKSYKDDTLMFSPLSFEYFDNISKEVDDQLLFSSGLMMCPILEQNIHTKTVYIPQRMARVRFEENSLKLMGIINPGDYRIFTKYDEMEFFLKPGGMLFTTKDKTINIYAFDNSNTFEILHDDGVSIYSEERVEKLEIRIIDKDIIIKGKISGFENLIINYIKENNEIYVKEIGLI